MLLSGSSDMNALNKKRQLVENESMMEIDTESNLEVPEGDVSEGCGSSIKRVKCDSENKEQEKVQCKQSFYVLFENVVYWRQFAVVVQQNYV